MNKRFFSLVLAAVMALSISVYAENEKETEEPLVISPAPEEKIEETISEEPVEKVVDIKLTVGEKLMIVEGDIGIPLDVPPTIINDRTMVPLRAIFEALGAVVSWDGETKTIFAVNGNTVVVMQIGQEMMYVNSERVSLDSPSVIVEDRTLVPVSAIAEAFGNNVEYDEETKTVKITG